MAKRPKLERELDAIYGGPAGAFVEGRNAVAKSLRDAGDTAEAKRVAALKKPSSAASVANGLALSKPKSITSLIRVTAEIRKAMSGTLDRDRMHSLTGKEHEIFEQLLSEAEAIAESHGEPASRATLDRVSDTLRAAQVDDEVRDLLVAGRLEREARAASVGLGNLAASPSSTPRRKPAPRKKAKKPPAPSRSSKAAKRKVPPKKVDKKRIRKAKEALSEATGAERAAKRGLAKAEGALTKAQRTLDAAEARVARAQAALSKSVRQK